MNKLRLHSDLSRNILHIGIIPDRVLIFCFKRILLWSKKLIKYHIDKRVYRALILNLFDWYEFDQFDCS